MKLQHFIGGLEGLPQPLTSQSTRFRNRQGRRYFAVRHEFKALNERPTNYSIWCDRALAWVMPLA